MSEFTEHYSKLSNSALFEILSNSSSYKAAAIKTAKEEIESRNLSEIEVPMAKQDIESKNREQEISRSKRKQKVDKTKESLASYFDRINPFHSEITTAEKTIRLITIIFGGISIYNIYNEFDMLQFQFENGISGWDLSMVEYFLPIFFLPLATILFWKRKRIGWIMLSAFLTYSGINAIGLFSITIGQQPIGIPAFDSAFPTVSPFSYLISFFFFSGTLWYICKETIRIKYHITKRSMINTLVIVTIINSTFIYLLFN